MAQSDKLLEKYGITTAKKLGRGLLCLQFYGLKDNAIVQSYSGDKTVKGGRIREPDYIFIFKRDDTYYYGWEGGTWLTSKTMIPLEQLIEVNKAKRSELNKAQIKRDNTVKKPMDAVKIMLRNKGYALSQCAGGVRVSCNKWIDLDITTKDDVTTDIKIEVCYNGDMGNKRHVMLEELPLGDPKFEAELNKIIYNFIFAKEILMGEKERVI